MKILNQNIWNINYFWKKRLKSLDFFLRQEALEKCESVVVLNEATSTDMINQIDDVNHILGFKNSVKLKVKKDQKKEYFIGVLTDIDVLSIKTYKLTQYSNIPNDSFPRIFSILELEASLGKLFLCVTHFSLNQEAQIKNAREGINLIEKQIKRDDSIVICSDFNCFPDSETVSLFKNEGFRDVWSDLVKEEFDSWPTSKEVVIQNHIVKYGKPPSWDIKSGRIDYILTRNISAKSIQKFGGKFKGIWHSDHYGLLAEF